MRLRPINGASEGRRQTTRPVKRSDGVRDEETQRIGSHESVRQDNDSSDAGREENV